MLKASIPTKFLEWFGFNTPGSNIRALLLTTGTPGQASLDQGFPPLNAIQTAGGGIPPDIRDMNGTLAAAFQWLQWVQAGGAISPWDSTFASGVTPTAGYPNGAIVSDVSTAGLFWVSTADNNTSTPGASASWTAFLLPRRQSTFIRITTTGSGTISPSSALVARWRVRMVAGGGAGGFGNSGGNAGVATSLRDWTVNAGAGGGAQNGLNASIGGAGGSSGANGTGTLIARISGYHGQFGSGANASSISPAPSITGSVQGGASALVGLGSGGRADGTLTNSVGWAAGGGGGEYVEFAMDNPNAGAPWNYVVGAGGASVGAEAGLAGVILIEEIYP
jgi:hypothetical protein